MIKSIESRKGENVEKQDKKKVYSKLSELSIINIIALTYHLLPRDYANRLKILYS